MATPSCDDRHRDNNNLHAVPTPTSTPQRICCRSFRFPDVSRLFSRPSVRLGVNSIAELIALAKKQPGLPYATGSGLGSPQHMAVLEWFAQIAGITLEQVPYRGGGKLFVPIGGHVKLGSLGSTPLISHYRAGTLRLLAESSKTRSSSLPVCRLMKRRELRGSSSSNGWVLSRWDPASHCRASRTATSTRPSPTPGCARAFWTSHRSPSAAQPGRVRPTGSRGLQRQVRAAGEGPEHQNRVARKKNAIFNLSSGNRWDWPG